ncbi:MAG: hypothetical protein SWQ30_07175 [Thermodesulfobacteriota bacterium]|nr:hypothetical protein [Thermodesulfobacteriota bacterium]
MEAKGTALEVLPRFILTRFGRESLDKWMRSLPRQARLEFGEGILSFRWYPLKTLLVDPTLILCELFYGGDFEGALEVGRFSAEYALKGIYKLFVRVRSPEFLIRRAKNILPTYYRPSAMEVIEMSRGRCTLRVTDFREMDEVIELRIKGWMEKAMEISGGKLIDLSIPKSLTKNDPYTDFVVTYK